MILCSRTTLRRQLTAANLPPSAHLCQLTTTNTTNSSWGKLSTTNSLRGQLATGSWRESRASERAECRVVVAAGGFPFSHLLPPQSWAPDCSEFRWFSNSSEQGRSGGWECSIFSLSVKMSVVASATCSTTAAATKWSKLWDWWQWGYVKNEALCTPWNSDTTTKISINSKYRLVLNWCWCDFAYN